MGLAVFIEIETLEGRNHLGVVEEVSYIVYINGAKLKRFSPRGDLFDGSWGSAAEQSAKMYATNVALAIGAKVYTVKRHKKPTMEKSHASI